MTYASRIDVVSGVALALCALSVVGCAVGGVVMLSTSVGASITFFACAVGMAALLWIVAWPVQYELADHALVIRFGRVRSEVPYADIEEVTPTRSLLAAPALSRDRLQIRARGRDAMISPDDKAGFLQNLAARAPGLVADGERLVRR